MNEEGYKEAERLEKEIEKAMEIFPEDFKGLQQKMTIARCLEVCCMLMYEDLKHKVQTMENRK